MRRIMFSSVLVLVAMVGLNVAAAGSSVPIGSLVGSKNATLDGQVALPHTTVLSGDTLEVANGVAMVSLEQGGRMILEHRTAASFSRGAEGVTVSLTRGNISLYHPEAGTRFRVKIGDVSVAPAQGYKTVGEIAVADGLVIATVKQGMLQVERRGRTVQVANGKVVTLPVKIARAPDPSSPVPPSGKAHITTATTLDILGLGAGAASAVLAGMAISRANDAKNAANSAGTAANAVGCALDAESGNPVSPYKPPSGYSCP